MREADAFLGQPDGELGGIFPQFVFGGAGHQLDLLHGLFVDSVHMMFGLVTDALAFGSHFSVRTFAQLLYFVLEIGQPLFDAAA